MTKGKPQLDRLDIPLHLPAKKKKKLLAPNTSTEDFRISLPVSNGLIPQPNFMISRPAKMVHKFIPKNLPSDTSRPGKPIVRLSQRFGQPYSHICFPTNILALSKRRARNLQLLLNAPPAKS